MNACSNGGTDTSCVSIIFSSYQCGFSKVCGQARGYKYSVPAVPLAFYRGLRQGGKLDTNYVDGVSITYDFPCKHIWTYAGGNSETGTHYSDCPCNTGNPNSPPSFVGNNYYCESALDSEVSDASDPLWDGQQCNTLEPPCCTAPNMPWFTTTLSDTTTSNIEARVCTSAGFGHTPIDIIQLYIK